MPPTIRPETPPDIPGIRAVIGAAFATAESTAPAAEIRIVDALRDAGDLTLSLVAVEAGGGAETVIGHVALSPVTLSPRPITDGSPDWYGLGPLAVAPERQGQGIGSNLVREALASLRHLGAAGCVVLGDPAFYGRFGFRAASTLVLPGVPPIYFQAVAFRGAVPEASVVYPAAFSVGVETQP